MSAHMSMENTWAGVNIHIGTTQIPHLVPVAVPRQPAGQQGPHRGAHGARPVHDGGDGGEGAAAAHQRAVRAQLRGHRGRDQGVGAVN